MVCSGWLGGSGLLTQLVKRWGAKLHILWMVSFVLGGGSLLTRSTDGWMAVLFGCWLGGIDALVRWRVSECHVGVELHVLVMARDFHFEGSEWRYSLFLCFTC